MLHPSWLGSLLSKNPDPGTGSGSFTSNLNNSGYVSFGTTTLTSAYHNLRNLNHDGNQHILTSKRGRIYGANAGRKDCGASRGGSR